MLAGRSRQLASGALRPRPRKHPEYEDLPAQRPDREARRNRSKAPSGDQKGFVQGGTGPVARDPEGRPRPIEMESDSGLAGRVRRTGALQLSITVHFPLFSEAELHVLRARLDGGIRNKAARGELRRGLPVGLVWGERDGEIRLHPDEAVTGAIRAVFERFAEFGSVRRVWLWFVSEKLTFPLRLNHGAAIRWVPPSYHAIHQVLTNPAYAGAGEPAARREVEVVLASAGMRGFLARRRPQNVVVGWRRRSRRRARVLTAVKARRCAPPPLRGADGLDGGSTHARPDWPRPTAQQT